jgi:OCT family organic cation transporter-like MFS transporter 18
MKSDPKSDSKRAVPPPSTESQPLWIRAVLGSDAASARVLLLVHVNIVVYAFAYWLTQPMLPFLSKQLGVSDLSFGFLSTVFSVSQLIGGPIIGRLCDTHGARLALQVSQAGAGLSYALLGAASSVEWLFASRVASITMHAMHASQAFIAVYSLPSLRAAALGRLSLSYGIGMVAGSSVGGLLSAALGYAAVGYLAALLSVAFIALNAALLPAIAAAPSSSSSSASVLDLSTVFQLLRNARVARVLAFQILLGTAISMYHTTFSIAAATRFGFDASTLGFFQSAGAVLGVLANTLLVGAVIDFFGGNDARVLQLCAAVFAACFVAYALVVSSVTGLFVLGVPFSIASSLFYTVATSALSKSVDNSNAVAGTTIGLGHAARSFCGIVGPTLGGLISQQMQFEAVGIASAAISLAALFAIGGS